jgi:hypothetical protein
MMATACSAEVDGEESEVLPTAQTSEVEPTAIKNGTSGTTTKSALEADGYTCKALEGTTLTLCWKGSSTYSCNDLGKCIETRTTPPPRPPIVVPPIATAVAP